MLHLNRQVLHEVYDYMAENVPHCIHLYSPGQSLPGVQIKWPQRYHLTRVRALTVQFDHDSLSGELSNATLEKYVQSLPPVNDTMLQRLHIHIYGLLGKQSRKVASAQNEDV